MNAVGRTGRDGDDIAGGGLQAGGADPVIDDADRLVDDDAAVAGRIENVDFAAGVDLRHGEGQRPAGVAAPPQPAASPPLPETQTRPDAASACSAKAAAAARERHATARRPRETKNFMISLPPHKDKA